MATWQPLPLAFDAEAFVSSAARGRLNPLPGSQDHLPATYAVARGFVSEAEAAALHAFFASPSNPHIERTSLAGARRPRQRRRPRRRVGALVEVARRRGAEEEAVELLELVEVERQPRDVGQELELAPPARVVARLAAAAARGRRRRRDERAEVRQECFQ